MPSDFRENQNEGWRQPVTIWFVNDRLIVQHKLPRESPVRFGLFQNPQRQQIRVRNMNQVNPNPEFA